MTTFLAINTKSQRVELVTRSARAARNAVKTGVRVDVWTDGKLEGSIYAKTAGRMTPFIEQEKRYHARKQENAEQKNKRRTRRTC